VHGCCHGTGQPSSSSQRPVTSRGKTQNALAARAELAHHMTDCITSARAAQFPYVQLAKATFAASFAAFECSVGLGSGLSTALTPDRPDQWCLWRNNTSQAASPAKHGVALQAHTPGHYSLANMAEEETSLASLLILQWMNRGRCSCAPADDVESASQSQMIIKY
jgi:hypothetical protein